MDRNCIPTMSLQKCPHLCNRWHVQEHSLEHYLQEIQTKANQNSAVEWKNILRYIRTMKYYIRQWKQMNSTSYKQKKPDTKEDILYRIYKILKLEKFNHNFKRSEIIKERRWAIQLKLKQWLSLGLVKSPAVLIVSIYNCYNLVKIYFLTANNA